MSYRCSICKDCSSDEEDYQSDADYPSDLSNITSTSDVERSGSDDERRTRRRSKSDRRRSETIRSDRRDSNYGSDQHSEYSSQYSSESACSSEVDSFWETDTENDEDRKFYTKTKPPNNEVNDEAKEIKDVVTASHGEIAEEQGDARVRRAANQSSSRHYSNRRNGSGNKRSRRTLQSYHVKMPTGKKFAITSPKPRSWNCGTPTKLVTLNPHGRMGRREFKIVAKEMQKTLVHHVKCESGGGCFKKYSIVKIEKLINGCLWKRYRHIQRDILNEVRFVNQRLLFHGSAHIDDLVQTGFNESYSNINGMFGAGLYFAKHSSKANQYAFGFMGGTGCPAHQDKNCYQCERKMLLCRVTLGKSRNFYTAQNLAHAPIGCNSVIGVPSKKKRGLKYPEYIVYRGEQVYPEYLITYKISQ